MAEDQRPVRDDVHQVGDDRDDHRRPHDPAARQVLPQCRVDEEEGEARDLGDRVGLCERGEFCILPEQEHRPIGHCPQDSDRNREQQGQDQPPLERAPLPDRKSRLSPLLICMPMCRRGWWKIPTS